MPVTIKALGLKDYLDRVYAVQGGYLKFLSMTKDGCQIQQIADHFGVNRKQIRLWNGYHAEEVTHG